jgi:hypothetical protein
VGLWYYVNLGIGYDLVYTFDHGTDHGMHLFLGVPLGKIDGFFVEPYSRVWFLWGTRDSTVAEVGMLLKYAFSFE